MNHFVTLIFILGVFHVKMSEAEKGLEQELKPLQNGEGADTPKNNSEPKFMETVKGKVIVAVSTILGILGLGLAIGLAMHFGGNWH